MTNKQEYVAPISKRGADWAGDEQPYLCLSITTGPEGRSFEINAVSSLDIEPGTKVGKEGVSVSLVNPNQVAVRVSEAEEGAIIDGPVWQALCTFATERGMALVNAPRSRHAGHVYIDMPGRQVPLETGPSLVHSVLDSQVAAAGLRLCVTYHDRQQKV